MEPSCCAKELATRRWSISSDLLKILWQDVYPRIVSRCWERPKELRTKDGTRTPPRFCGDAAEFIRAYADDLWYTDVGTKTFRKQLRKLRRYLKGRDDQCPTPIPIFGLPGDGFDFVISDDGLDLLLPPDPWRRRRYTHPEVEIYRLYTYRKTAERAIKVPGVTGAQRETAIPNAVTTDTLESLIHLHAGHVRESADKLSRVKRGDEEGERERVWCDALERGAGEPEDDCDDEGEATHGCDSHMDLGSYCHHLGEARCWQVTGRVYRAILHDLPRLVAWIWLEQEVERAGAGNVLSYEDRWSDPGNDGLRSIFSERLEILLPDEACMMFEPDFPTSEVLLTNQGLFFPPLPKRPNRAQLLESWKSGTGGIPVFTDSSRTD